MVLGGCHRRRMRKKTHLCSLPMSWASRSRRMFPMPSGSSRGDRDSFTVADADAEDEDEDDTGAKRIASPPAKRADLVRPRAATSKTGRRGAKRSGDQARQGATSHHARGQTASCLLSASGGGQTHEAQQNLFLVGGLEPGAVPRTTAMLKATNLPGRKGTALR